MMWYTMTSHRRRPDCTEKEGFNSPRPREPTIFNTTSEGVLEAGNKLLTSAFRLAWSKWLGKVTRSMTLFNSLGSSPSS